MHRGRQVKAHILDPQAGFRSALGLSTAELAECGFSGPTESPRVEEWTIGTEVTDEQYEEFADRMTGHLYVIIAYEKGEPHPMIVRKDLWEELAVELPTPSHKSESPTTREQGTPLRAGQDRLETTSEESSAPDSSAERRHTDAHRTKPAVWSILARAVGLALVAVVVIALLVLIGRLTGLG